MSSKDASSNDAPKEHVVCLWIKVLVKGGCTLKRRDHEDMCHDAGRGGSNWRMQGGCCSDEVVLLIGLPAWKLLRSPQQAAACVIELAQL